MENNIDQQIDNEFEAMKQEITREVREQLASTGVTVIPNDYKPGHELVKLIDEYNVNMKKLQQQIDHNNEIYKPEKANTENYLVRADIQDLKAETQDKLDNILVKQQMLMEQQIKGKQSDPSYKEAKKELLNVVSLLSRCKEIPTDMLMDTLEPSIVAGDTKTLALCKVLLQNNFMASYTVERAMDGINDILANTDLKLAVDSMKKYVQTGEDTVSYYQYLYKYQ